MRGELDNVSPKKGVSHSMLFQVALPVSSLLWHVHLLLHITLCAYEALRSAQQGDWGVTAGAAAFCIWFYFNSLLVADAAHRLQTAVGHASIPVPKKADLCSNPRNSSKCLLKVT